jgi:4'-phosphopantetheinyl transferase
MSLESGEAHIWYAWTAACDTLALRDYYFSLLTDEERARHEAFAFDSLKLEYLVTRALCRTVLSAYAGVPPTSWRFIANAYGRPEISEPALPARLHFSLSNARSLVALVVTGEGDAGIDVEDMAYRGDTLSIAHHYFSLAELRDLHALPRKRQLLRFFELWTLKESYIKARGMGLAIPLDQFSFHLQTMPIRIAFDPRLADTAADWQFQLYRPGRTHLMAVAVRHPPQAKLSVRVREVIPGPQLVWKDVVCDC